MKIERSLKDLFHRVQKHFTQPYTKMPIPTKRRSLSLMSVGVRSGEGAEMGGNSQKSF